MLKLKLLNFVSCCHGNALFQREGMTLAVSDEVGGGGEVNLVVNTNCNANANKFNIKKTEE